MPENIYDQDRFYVDLETDRVIWMYHNTDAVSGDQFVCNIFDKDLLKEAIQECPIGPDSGFEPTPVFDYLAENCRQYLSDVDEIAYDANKERFESDPICIGMTHGTLETLQLLYDARQLINDYCLAEFGSSATFKDLRKVGIAYTTTEDETHEIQAYANLIDHRTEVYFDDSLVAVQEPESLKDYVENLLPYLDFNELVDIPDWVVDAVQGKGRFREDLKFMQVNSWNQTYDICVEIGAYMCGGGLAMELYDICEGDLEPFSNFTINLPEYKSDSNCAFVDTNNFGEAENLIRAYKLGEPTGRYGRSGYCTYPEYRFDLEEIRKYCINPDDINIHEPIQKERSDER